jgi:hypothetical protein
LGWGLGLLFGVSCCLLFSLLFSSFYMKGDKGVSTDWPGLEDMIQFDPADNVTQPLVPSLRWCRYQRHWIVCTTFVV